jgi:hypothetical protein
VCLSCDNAGLGKASVAPKLPDPGTPGSSARREAERRRRNREESVLEDHPHIGNLLLSLSEEPHHIRAFDIGGEGEEWLGYHLNALQGKGVLALHDRRRLRSRGNIDHIVVAPTGVYVVDAKHYEGKVRREVVGGFLNSTLRLYVGPRDCTRLAGRVRGQMADVAEVLGSAAFDVKITPVLCFVGSEWGLFTKPFIFDRVLVTWPKALFKWLMAEKTITFDMDCEIVQLLNQRFRPA